MQGKYERLVSGSKLPVLEGFFPYKAILLAELSVSREWKEKVSRWLVDTGCRYMMAWGEDCLSWETAVDTACLEAHGFGEVPEDDLIATTCHVGESLADLFFYAKMNTSYRNSPIGNLLILHVGLEDRRIEFFDRYKEA